MKVRIAVMIALCGSLFVFAAPRSVCKTFDWPHELKYSFLPKQKMTVVVISASTERLAASLFTENRGN